MSLYLDPEMKDVVIEFCNESDGLIAEMEKELESFEENLNKNHLEKFGSLIDRIMGAAKTLEIAQIGIFCELGKTIGYKSSQSDNMELLKITASILMDATEILNQMVTSVREGKNLSEEKIDTAAFATRLKWLSEKFKDIARGSVELDKK